MKFARRAAFSSPQVDAAKGSVSVAPGLYTTARHGPAALQIEQALNAAPSDRERSSPRVESRNTVANHHWLLPRSAVKMMMRKRANGAPEIAFRRRSTSIHHSQACLPPRQIPCKNFRREGRRDKKKGGWKERREEGRMIGANSHHRDQPPKVVHQAIIKPMVEAWKSAT